MSEYDWNERAAQLEEFRAKAASNLVVAKKARETRAVNKSVEGTLARVALWSIGNSIREAYPGITPSKFIKAIHEFIDEAVQLT